MLYVKNCYNESFNVYIYTYIYVNKYNMYV